MIVFDERHYLSAAEVWEIDFARSDLFGNELCSEEIRACEESGQEQFEQGIEQMLQARIRLDGEYDPDKELREIRYLLLKNSLETLFDNRASELTRREILDWVECNRSNAFSFLVCVCQEGADPEELKEMVLWRLRYLKMVPRTREEIRREAVKELQEMMPWRDWSNTPLFDAVEVLERKKKMSKK